MRGEGGTRNLLQGFLMAIPASLFLFLSQSLKSSQNLLLMAQAGYLGFPPFFHFLPTFVGKFL